MTENKQYRMFDMGCAYLTYCGVKSDEDEFENMTECCEELNRLSNENEQLKQSIQDYEDNVSNWFIENWHTLSDEQKQSAHLELGIDIEYGGDVE